jgi:hypothetical protein
MPTPTQESISRTSSIEPKMPCDTDLLLRLSSELEEAASPTFHLTKMKTTVAYSKCNCLHSLLYKDSGQL